MKFKVNKDYFVERILNPVSKITDNLHLAFRDNRIKTLASSVDSSVILLLSMPCQTETDDECHIPDCKTFLRLFSSIEEQTIELEINNNSIVFSGKKINFKYHLLDSLYSPTKKTLSEQKINSLEYDTSFVVTKRNLSEISKFNTIIPEAEKLYFFTQNGCVYAKIGDEQKANTNELTFLISEHITGKELACSIPISIQNVLSMSFVDDAITIKVNQQLKLLKFETEAGFYVVSGLVK